MEELNIELKRQKRLVDEMKGKLHVLKSDKERAA
jgi:hypothetical protein